MDKLQAYRLNKKVAKLFEPSNDARYLNARVQFLNDIEQDDERLSRLNKFSRLLILGCQNVTNTTVQDKLVQQTISYYKRFNQSVDEDFNEQYGVLLEAKKIANLMGRKSGDYTEVIDRALEVYEHSTFSGINNLVEFYIDPLSSINTLQTSY